ncbi:MFS transporter [Helicovermis profundi]|uniref:MFS transporter n=1 Tax=Helicovermis profundi TaxID=3065157 RepID=A0AAU9E867_9FIRM|nr:MFS transporter [Clostridia bacterium S502]
MKLFSIYRNLSRSVYILFLAQVINRMGGFVMPFLTFFLVQKMGVSVVESGTIVSIVAIMTLPGSQVGGYLSDKIGRKITYLIMQTLAGVFLLPIPFLNNILFITIFLSGAMFFNGAVRPSISAIVADSVNPKNRQAGYSLIYLGINIGVAIGPIIAGFLFNNFLTLLFLGDAFSSFIAVILVFIFIKKTNQNNIVASKEEEHSEENIINILRKKPNFLFFLLISTLLSFIYSQHRFALPLMLNTLFLSKGPTYFGFIMSVNAITVLVVSAILLKLTKDFKPLINMSIAGITYALGFGMIFFINNFFMFIVSTFIWTIGEVLIVTNSGVYIANNSPINYRGRFYAISSIAFSLGTTLGIVMSGILIHLFSIRILWLIVSITALLTSIFSYLTAKKQNAIN